MKYELLICKKENRIALNYVPEGNKGELYWRFGQSCDGCPENTFPCSGWESKKLSHPCMILINERKL